MTETIGWDADGMVEEQRSELWIRRGAPPRMGALHRQEDVEINLVLRGSMHYLFAGRPLTVNAGEIAVFWAAQPHGLVGANPGDACWIHVPFATVLGWGLPEAETAPLLSARPLITRAPGLAERVAHLAERWVHEVPGAVPDAEDDHEDSGDAEIALLEIQAAVRRILRVGTRPDAVAALPGAGAALPDAGAVPAGRLRQVSAMAQHVMDHHRGPLTVADIAAAVHLTPPHAMTVFRSTTGVTLGQYVTMTRVGTAQRLLLTTAMTTTEIADSAGFGSLSSFYQHVTAACGTTPREYRRRG